MALRHNSCISGQMKLKLGSNIKDTVDPQFGQSDVVVCLFLVKNIKSTPCQSPVEIFNPIRTGFFPNC